ncbi:hypothetical protein ACTFIZ_010366 [Dictyostelium cf. discoideum]
MIKIISWNSQGCSTSKSYNQIKDTLNIYKPDISLLLETNIQKSNKINNLPNHYSTCGSKKEARGKGILVINNSNQLNLNNIEELEPGRIIKFSISIKNVNLNVISIYAPASFERRRNWFSNNISLDELVNADIVIGDFNINKYSKIKIKDNSIHKKDFIENLNLEELMEEAGLTELISQNGIEFSFQKRLIDRVFVSNKIIQLKHSFKIIEKINKSDHNILNLEIEIPNFTKMIFKNQWKMNSLVIKQNKSIVKLGKIIDHFSNPHDSNIINSWLSLKKKVKKECILIENNIINKRKKLIKVLAYNHSKSINENEKKEIANSISILQKEEKKDLMTKSSIDYINNKEIASNLLTFLLKKKSNNTIITQIRNPINKQLESNEKEIRECFKEYYEKLFEKKNCNEISHNELLKSWCPLINSQSLKELEKEISEDEIKLAIEKINEGKAPGEDGITSTFYKTHLFKLLPILIQLFNYFLNHDIPQVFKNGVLVSIYKGKGDILDLTNRRPITLLNVDYKIFSKIINNRILKIIPYIISNYQNGFIPGRILHSNIISLDLAIKKCNNNNNNKETIFTFYDFEKAFDSISHESVIRTFKHLNFPPKIINTIKNMLSDSRIKVLVNGEMSEPFITQRGTKQGDPISPTLFAIVCECMSAAIRSDKRIEGIELNQNNNLKLMQFADDTVTIAKNSQEEKLINELILKFCESTSAKINADKCVCISINKNKETIYRKMDENGEERYLGFNFSIKGISSKVEYIIDRIENLSKSYSKISSTFKGRLAILKSYLLSQLTFHLYINEINNLNKLETICANMIFNGNDKWKMSKKRCRKEYAMGGLELWDMELRSLSQKAWIYEWYLRDKDSVNCSPFMNCWKSESLVNQSSFHKICWSAWLNLHTINQRNNIDYNNTQPYFNYKTKLKIIYKTMLDNNNPKWNIHEPTLGQIKLQNSLNNAILPFREARKIMVIKGRDLIWRYLLKALPKYFGEKCNSCGEMETSEHIFFTCKNIQSICSQIYFTITKESNNTNYGTWSELLLKRLYDKFQANLIGSLMDLIWHRRNKLKFDNEEPLITLDLVVYKLYNARDAEWEKNLIVINHLLRIESKNNNLDFTFKIMKKLEKFNNIWNSKLMKMHIPDHLKKYCSFNTN